MQKNKLTEREKKELINRIEKRTTRKTNKSNLEMYLSQTDRNYKDGDRN